MSGKTLQLESEATHDTITLPFLSAPEGDCEGDTEGSAQPSCDHEEMSISTKLVLIGSSSCCTKPGTTYFQGLLEVSEQSCKSGVIYSHAQL